MGFFIHADYFTMFLKTYIKSNKILKIYFFVGFSLIKAIIYLLSKNMMKIPCIEDEHELKIKTF